MVRGDGRGASHATGEHLAWLPILGRWAPTVWNVRAVEPLASADLALTMSSGRHSISGDGGASSAGDQGDRVSSARNQSSVCDLERDGVSAVSAEDGGREHDSESTAHGLDAARQHRHRSQRTQRAASPLAFERDGEVRQGFMALRHAALTGCRVGRLKMRC
jgi:hypothetical protein